MVSYVVWVLNRFIQSGCHHFFVLNCIATMVKLSILKYNLHSALVNRDSVIRNRSLAAHGGPMLHFSLVKELILDPFEFWLCLCARYYLWLFQVKIITQVLFR